MKIPSIVTALLVLMSVSVMHAAFIIVGSDGSADAESIQAGINMAADGDTVLIAQGVWTGDVLIENKSITLGSFYIADGDTTHISRTIIDGEDLRTGIIVQNSGTATSPLKISGLTIRNCRSNSYPLTEKYSNGGGISLMRSTAFVEHCIIHHCRASYGGGVSAQYSYLTLIGNDIYLNHGLSGGGGLSAFSPNSGITFDQFERNSIYLNTSSRGNDVTYGVSCDPTVIYLERGSVLNNDPYFYYSPSHHPVHINQGSISQVNQDLWVSPQGDNANDGLSPSAPLRNISYALAKVQPDGNSNPTVHVLPGRYSWSQTGEALPLQLKSYVNLIGETMEEVILDAEHYGAYIMGYMAQDYLTIANFTLVNGFEKHSNLFWLDDHRDGETDKITVKNIHIKDSWAIGGAFVIMSCHDLTVDNLIIEDSQVGNGFVIWAYETGVFSNFRVQRLSATNYDMYSSSCTGGGISKPLRAASLNTTIDISNFLITDIVDTSQFWPDITSGLAFTIEGGNCDLTINNCTIANNSSVTQSGGLNLSLENTNIEINNTIVTGNTPYEVATFAWDESSYAGVTFNNCLITGGSDSFFHLSGSVTTTWGEGNLYGQPLFQGGDDIHDPLYYSLSSASAGIDAGTPDITELALPPYDLVGNQRVWNDRIDIGCFEFGSQPWVSNDDQVVQGLNQLTLHQNYPNPFNPTTTISYSLPEATKMRLDIYNLKGQLVKTLINTEVSAGLHSVVWNGKDMNNTAVASGVYFYRVSSQNGIQTKRMLLMK
jgi:hypothetical protein